MRTFILARRRPARSIPRWSRNCPSKLTRGRRSCCRAPIRRSRPTRSSCSTSGAWCCKRTTSTRAPEYLAEGYVATQSERRDRPRRLHGVLRSVSAGAGQGADRRPRQHRRRARPRRARFPPRAARPRRAKARPTRRRGSTCSGWPTARSSSTGTTARKSSRQRSAQYFTRCAARNRSASRPRSKRQRREHAGLRARRCRHRDRARRVDDGPTCRGIENVAVALAVLEQKAARVAARRERADAELDVPRRRRRSRCSDSMPTRHGAPPACGPSASRSPPKFSKHASTAAAREPRRDRPRTPCRCRRDRSPCPASSVSSGARQRTFLPADDRQATRRPPRGSARGRCRRSAKRAARRRTSRRTCRR